MDGFMNHISIYLILFLGAVVFGLATTCSTKNDTKSDILKYALASISLLFLTSLLLLCTPTVYEMMGGLSFFPVSKSVDGVFDIQAFGGFIQILLGVPIAIAGSLYAILLARQSEKQATTFNQFEINKSLRVRLDDRNAIIQNLSKSLREINLSAFIINSQLNKVLLSLAASDLNTQDELNKVEVNGFSLLKESLNLLHTTTNAIVANRVQLDNSCDSPLKRILESNSLATEIETESFLQTCKDRDMVGIADYFLLRSKQLSIEDLVQTHLFRLTYRVIRWTKNENLQKVWPDLKEWIVLDHDDTGADVGWNDESLGFRFIGSALLNTNLDIRSKDGRQNLNYTFDLGSTLLIDLYLSLPNTKKSIEEIESWEEYIGLVDSGGKVDFETLIQEPKKHFPNAFMNSIGDICNLYSSNDKLDDIADKDHRSLLTDAAPNWIVQEYRSISRKLVSSEPPSLKIVEHLIAFTAIVTLIKQDIDNLLLKNTGFAKILSFLNIDNINQIYLKKGPESYEDYRLFLITRRKFAQQTENSIKDNQDFYQDVKKLLSELPTGLLRLRLHLDIGDWLTQDEQLDEAQAYYKKALQDLESLDYRVDVYGKPDSNFPTDKHIFLLSVWLDGFLNKLPYSYCVDIDEEENGLSTYEASALWGFLPNFVRYLDSKDLIQKSSNEKIEIVDYKDGDTYTGKTIKPGQMIGFDFARIGGELKSLADKFQKNTRVDVYDLFNLSN